MTGQSTIAPGQVREVTATGNPAVKEIRGLSLKKHREASGRFVAEGLKLVTDALETGWPVHTLVYARNKAGEPHLQSVAARAKARGALILEASDKVMAAISRKDNPQTALGVFGQQWMSPGDIRPAGDDLWIGLDRVRDPGNLGTILRTADAVGARGVLLIGDCTDPFSLEAVRASMGSVFAVPVSRLEAQDFAKWRRDWPGLVVGAHMAGNIDYRAVAKGEKPVLLLMGIEQQGLPADMAQSCDLLCRIPMAGSADSLNLAVATGIMAFELRRDALTLRGQS